MKIDFVKDRAIIAAARRIVSRVPFAWSLYEFYWSLRQVAESKREWPCDKRILDFGDYPDPSLSEPVSQLCTAEQMTGPLYREWCRKISSPARFSRKQWEFVYIMQALHRAGMLLPGKMGVGFGCGREPLPGIFAKAGVNVLATDLAPSDAEGRGWIDTMQHAASLGELYSASRRIVDRQVFTERVSFQSVDMNAVPPELFGRFDFVWSACALEHLGSLQHGLDFIRNSAKCLKVGGVAVHTTEFNLSSDDETVEHRDCSVYRKQDIKQLQAALEKDGFSLAPINLSVGRHSVDHHVDVPPYSMSPHIRLELEQFVVTSIGLIVTRKS